MYYKAAGKGGREDPVAMAVMVKKNMNEGHLFFKNGLTQQLAMEGQGPVGTTGWCHSLSWTPEGQTHPFGQRISRDPSDVF